MQNLAARRIHERDDSFRRERDQTGGDRLDHVLIERAERGEILAVNVELFRCLLQFFRDVGCQQRGRIKTGEVRGDIEIQTRGGPCRWYDPRLLRQRDEIVENEIAEGAVENHRAARGKESPSAVEHHRCGDDRDEVEERERRIERAGEVNQKRLDQQVARELNRQIDFSRLEKLTDADVEQRQAVRYGRRRVEIIDRQNFGDGVLNDERSQQQRRDNHDADRDEHSGVGRHVGRWPLAVRRGFLRPTANGVRRTINRLCR